MSDMPKTTFFLTALSLTGLYLWRIHRRPRPDAMIDAGGGLDPGTGVEAPPGRQALHFASQRVGDPHALSF
jgi:hypothetical protein